MHLLLQFSLLRKEEKQYSKRNRNNIKMKMQTTITKEII